MLVELDFGDCLLLLALLKSPLLCFVYFKFVDKSNDAKVVKSVPENTCTEN